MLDDSKIYSSGGALGGEEKRSGRLVGVAKNSKELAEWRRLQQKSLSALSLLKRKEWSSATARAVGKYAGAALPKEKGTNSSV